MKLNPEVSAGDLLTVLSLLGAISSFAISQAKDRQLRRKEFAERVRNAAAVTLAKLERWRDIALLKFRDVPPAVIGLLDGLSGANTLIDAREKLWKELFTIQSTGGHRISQEEIEIAYVGLYSYHPRVYESFGATISAMRRLDEGVWLRFMESSQDAILAWLGREKELQPTLLENQLRAACAKYEKQLRDDLDRIIEPMHRTLEQIISQSDLDIVKGKTVISTPIGRRRALCVGIDRYPPAPLSGCIADVKEWSETLQLLGFEQPRLLCNEAATRRAIIDALHQLVDSSTAGDSIVFQFSGHGTTFRVLDSYGRPTQYESTSVLCPVDYAEGKVIFNDDMDAVFQRIPVGVNMTIFLDCCFSGVVTRIDAGRDIARAPSQLDRRPRYLFASPEMNEVYRAFELKLARRGKLDEVTGEMNRSLVMFYACNEYEVAFETDGRGHFSSKATQLLRETPTGLTNEEFVKKLQPTAEEAGQQHPVRECVPELSTSLLFAPIVEIKAMK
jgi:Caspase domain